MPCVQNRTHCWQMKRSILFSSLTYQTSVLIYTEINFSNFRQKCIRYAMSNMHRQAQVLLRSVLGLLFSQVFPTYVLKHKYLISWFPLKVQDGQRDSFTPEQLINWNSKFMRAVYISLRRRCELCTNQITSSNTTLPNTWRAGNLQKTDHVNLFQQ